MYTSMFSCFISSRNCANRFEVSTVSISMLLSEPRVENERTEGQVEGSRADSEGMALALNNDGRRSRNQDMDGVTRLPMSVQVCSRSER